MLAIRLLAVVTTLFVSGSAFAQMFTDPMSSTGGNKMHVAGVFSSSDIEYEEDGLSDDVERKTLGVEAAKGMSPTVDLYGQLGIIMDTEIGDFDDDGTGFTFGAGAKSIVHRDPGYKVSAYGFFSYQTEEIEEGSVEVEMDTYDLHGGAVVGFNASPTILPYVGLEMEIISYGDIKVKAGDFSSKDDIERDDMLNLKLGALFNLTSAMIRAEATLMGEETITLAVGTLF